mmetsp:Transcript_12786/g.49921  ORF Transcript_12786/g.49921 Transcript_12786/m.49921 type:complete len:232 (+) Transcript_12786:440-1135(+)
MEESPRSSGTSAESAWNTCGKRRARSGAPDTPRFTSISAAGACPRCSPSGRRVSFPRREGSSRDRDPRMHRPKKRPKKRPTARRCTTISLSRRWTTTAVGPSLAAAAATTAAATASSSMTTRRRRKRRRKRGATRRRRRRARRVDGRRQSGSHLPPRRDSRDGGDAGGTARLSREPAPGAGSEGRVSRGARRRRRRPRRFVPTRWGNAGSRAGGRVQLALGDGGGGREGAN